jgi:acyl carrier protein phosphodiesterase
MNWLAHFALSSDDDRERLGNWLPDLFGAAELEPLTDPAVRRGVELHRLIDRTTDRHPQVRAAMAALPPRLRRGGGIVLDVFWDHFLAREFVRYTGRELRPFINITLEGLARTAHLAPAVTVPVLERMRAEDWLGSYETLDGVEMTLHRIRRRLSPRAREVLAPGPAREFLASNHAELQAQFDVLWRDVASAVAAFRR